MQNLDKRFNRISRATYQSSLVVAVAFACIAMDSAHAQVLVTDVPAEAAAGTTATASTAMEAFQAGTQYLNFVAQLTQLTSTVSSIASNPLGAILPSTNTMTELSPATRDQLIQGKCSSATSGGIVSGLLQGLSSAVSAIDLGGNITQAQQQICGNIVFAQVDEYNATVDLYGQMPKLRDNMTAVQGMVQQLNGIMGNSSSSTAQTVAFTQQEQQQISEWQTRVNLDENIIKTLNQQQSTLAAVSLKGNPNLIGNAVQDLALQKAFEIND
jgi:hypothetical protein